MRKRILDFTGMISLFFGQGRGVSTSAGQSCDETGSLPAVAPRSGGVSPKHSRSAAVAACQPDIPWTPGPGGVDEEHK
jgi:hypothetical protein